MSLILIKIGFIVLNLLKISGFCILIYFIFNNKIKILLKIKKEKLQKSEQKEKTRNEEKKEQKKKKDKSRPKNKDKMKKEEEKMENQIFDFYQGKEPSRKVDKNN